MIIHFPKKYIADEDFATLKKHLIRLSDIRNMSAIEYVLNYFIQAYTPFEDIEICNKILSILRDKDDQ